jgi:putative transposase
VATIAHHALDVTFHQIVHSGRIMETGVTLPQFSRIAPNEHPRECPTDPLRREEMAIAVLGGRLSKTQAARHYGVTLKIVKR